VDHDGRLGESSARRRASAGIFYVFSSGSALLVLGFVGNLVLARLLSPRDFGLVALGVTVITISQTLSDGGLAAALIRKEDPPSRKELRSITGLQLVITTVIAALSIVIALQFGQAGAVAAVMIASLPLSALQTAGRVILLRRLAFGTISVIDASAMIAYYGWSLPAAFAGTGAWSMATGTVVRSLVATGLVLVLSHTRILPSFRHFRQLGPLIRFGIPFQLTWIVQASREQLLNVGAAALGGVTLLGEWSLANRVMQMPQLVFNSVTQVAYPAMSRVLTDRGDARAVLERGSRMAAIIGALTLAPFAAPMPTFVPLVFGSQWRDAGIVIPFVCLGLGILGPVYVTAAGYLNAVNRPTDALRSVAVPTAVMVPVAISLMPRLGIVALGVSWVVNGIVEAVMFARHTARECSARLLRQVATPVVVGTMAGSVGIVIGEAGGVRLLSSAAASAATLLLSLIGLLIACRPDLVAAFGMLRRSVKNATSKEAVPAVPESLEESITP
jgi:O-antigen/teichoic acid export membrane protein